MKKIALGAGTYLYPQPVTLIGTIVDDSPNYMVCTYCGIAQHKPPMISISLMKSHYTNAGIKKYNAFSVNIPTASMVQLADYCGIVSGRSVDKSSLFTPFYGQLETAPMIRECALNLECRLVQTVDFQGSSELFIGEIVEVYTEEKFVTNGTPDIHKINPIVFSIYENHYWKIGAHLGQAWSIGRQQPPPD